MLVEAVVDRQVGRRDHDLGHGDWWWCDRGACDLEVRQAASRQHRVEMGGERCFTGVGGSQVEKADIDSAGAAGLQTGVERLPGTPERFAREHALAKHRAAERLRLPDQRPDDVAIVDDVRRTMLAASATGQRQNLGGAEEADEPGIVEIIAALKRAMQ